MAFIYTPLNTGTPALDPLVARIYADGVDVYPANLIGGVFTPPHKLRGCTRFQWQFDHERDGTFVDVAGAITDTYQVPENLVENSGDYRCRVTIGEIGGECEEFTQTRTIVIIDCQSVSPITFQAGAGAGSRTISVIFPHFLRNSVVVTSPDWITHMDIVCAQTSGNCDEISSLTAVANSTNSFRNGYVDVQIGDFLCSYPVQQVNTLTEPSPDPPVEDSDPPLGPQIFVSAIQSEVALNGIIIPVATAQVLLPNGNIEQLDDSAFAWTVTGDVIPGQTVRDASAFGGISSQFGSLDTSTLGAKTVMFSVTVNGITVSDSVTVTVISETASTEAGAISGETTGLVLARAVRIGANQGPFLDSALSRASGSFSVDSGNASVFVNFTDRGFIPARYQYVGNATFTFTISGPGIRGGSFTRNVSLAAGEPNPSVPFFDPAYVAPITNSETLSSSDFTDHPDGYIIPGNYRWSLVINSAGQNPAGRFQNTVLVPSATFNVSPIFNFGFDFSNLNFDF